jgi:hypothetical protein
MVVCGRSPCSGLLDGSQQKKLSYWRVRRSGTRQCGRGKPARMRFSLGAAAAGGGSREP